MNKAEKAMISLLAAQLEVMIAGEDRRNGVKGADAAFTKAAAAARKIASHYVKPAAAKAAPVKRAKRR